MNKKILILLIITLIVIASVGTYLVLQKLSLDEKITTTGTTTSVSLECPSIAKPSPVLEDQCEAKDGKMQPMYRDNCIVKYQCSK